MAELLLKIGDKAPVGDPSTWEDGDIIHAFDDATIGWMWLSNICHQKHAALDSNGLRPDGLSRGFFERTKQYRYERLGGDEYRITDLWSKTSQQVTDASLTAALTKLLSHPKHAVYGVPNAQVWYGGNSRYIDDTVISDIWDHVEASSPLLRVDHRLAPLSATERKFHLSVSVDAFDGATRETLESQEYTENGTFRIIKRRVNFVDWEGKLPLTGRLRQDIKNPDIEIEIRDFASPQLRSAIVTTKP